MENIIEEAHEMLKSYMGIKSQYAKIIVDENAQEVSYDEDEDSLIVPSESKYSLSDALYNIKLASVLFENNMDIENIPDFLVGLVKNIANAVEREAKNRHIAMEALTINDKGLLLLPYHTLNPTDNRVLIGLMRNHIQIETNKGVLIKEYVPQEEYKPTLFRCSATFYEGQFAVRLPNRLIAESDMLVGNYQFAG